MGTSKYILIGRALDKFGLNEIPKDLRFPFKLGPPQGEVSLQTKFRLGPAVHFLNTTEYQCPLCPPGAPMVTEQVLTACGLGAAAQVAVQCSNGHWAAYPCR